MGYRGLKAIAALWTLLTAGIRGPGAPTCSRPLVLCPASLVANWGAELSRWLEGRVAPVVVDDTRGEKVKEVLATFGSRVVRSGGRGGGGVHRAQQYQVLVMGYTTFRMHREAVVRKGVDIVICDEAHTLKNGESQLTKAVAGLPARMRLLLSGTPIQNDLASAAGWREGGRRGSSVEGYGTATVRYEGVMTEFYTLFNVAVPGLLGEPSAFRRTFEHPILRGQDADASDAEVAVGAERSAQLLQLCGRFMLRRTCGLMKKYLPPKVEQVAVLEMMLKAVREGGSGDKVVLVSNYTEALDVLEVMCRTHGWVSLRLDGSCSVKSRQPIVDTFNDPSHPSFLLLLSSKAGGVGLNIIGANRLVLFDPDWNPANDLQAMARVWRQGQKKKVWIYRLLTTGTIEEKVYQRQLAKQGLSAAVVDDTAAQSRTFSQDELRALFEVNTTTMCDTHGAIKCSCDGSAAAARAKQEQAKRQQQAAAAATAAAEAAVEGQQGKDDDDDDDGTLAKGASGPPANKDKGKGEGKGKGEHEGGTVDDGIMQWAHLASVADSVDPIWQGVSSWLRDKFTTYLFSDHIINDSPKEGVEVEDEEEAGEDVEGEDPVCDDIDYGDYE
ncbi:hypothetical protein VOLCADRAFT_107785 [Volvox carteri f. nagariensis]|uniref:SNF2 super family n=1 Tax=Volvox carteri f. nagariensis TaxID=3068 RepID=D8UGC7_VOLCA|nr:uncharacterized protein VOLCADRAFT_107785 [Volvox carteri f. nagariensis]EFJ41266.1 hypothetical protein VOLCADRAFT_107785 [Volvox carteri f. nagariensis]|eukprot:XP_002957717.1 hypothetical protein VOLCADRAFT_107785 [Volvox carteri f. nagariensis]